MRSLDSKDLMILAELMEDSSATLVEIGKRLDLHPNVVAYRINKMQKAGVIKRYTTVVDFEKLGLSEHVYIGVSFPDHAGRDDVLKQVAGIPQVSGVVSALGNPEGLIFIVARNKAEVDKAMSRMRELNVKIEFTASIIKAYQDGLLSRLLRLQAKSE